jgi:hypothetical protein
MRFPSQELLDKVRDTDVWQREVLKDCIGFVSHAYVIPTERVTWLADPVVRSAYRAQK